MGEMDAGYWEEFFPKDTLGTRFASRRLLSGAAIGD
jgi:hypothetical protein